MNTKNNTHTVIKNTDIDKYLSPKDASDLKALIMRLAVAKRCNSSTREDNRYYICNVDEPYSEEVLSVILKGEQNKCDSNNPESKQVNTNAEKLRNMTDEELAKLISSGEWSAICPLCAYYGTGMCRYDEEGNDIGSIEVCERGTLKFLQSKVEVEK